MAVTVDALRAAWPMARSALVDALPGYPPRASGSDIGGSGGRTILVNGDRIPITGVEAAALLPDRAKDDMRALEDAIAHASRVLDRAYRLAVSWSTVTTRVPDVRHARVADDAFCSHHLTVNILEPRGNRYADDLCRWCHEFRDEVGQLPHVAILERRHRGDRITEPVIRRHHPHYRPKVTV